MPYSEASKADWTNQFYGECTAGRLRIDSEYRRYWRNQELFGGTSESFADVRGWYVSGAYRISKRLQIGSYYSRYTITNVVSGALAPFILLRLTLACPLTTTTTKSSRAALI